MRLEDGDARFDEVTESRVEGSHAWYRVVLREGRNREVRRLWQAVGSDVSRLLRIRYGPVQLPRELIAGHWQLLDTAVHEQLRVASAKAQKAPAAVAPIEPAAPAAPVVTPVPVIETVEPAADESPIWAAAPSARAAPIATRDDVIQRAGPVAQRATPAG